MDTISPNKNTVTSFIDALFTKGDLGAVDEYLAEDFVDHDLPMGGSASPEGMRRRGIPVARHRTEQVLHYSAPRRYRPEVVSVLLAECPTALPGRTAFLLADGKQPTYPPQRM